MASDWLPVVVFLSVVAVPVVALSRRAGEQCVLEVRAGQLTVRRGEAPAAMLRDLRDVVRDVTSARLRLKRVDGRLSLSADGLSEGELQRARNVVGRFAGARIGRH